MDSNHRSNLQQIYSLSPLATRESTHSSHITVPDSIVLYTILFQKSRGFLLNFDSPGKTDAPKERFNSIDIFLLYNYNIIIYDIKFQWDDNKNKINQKKHKISFEEAQSVFFDEEALIIDDPEHSLEDERFIILGLSKKANLLVVCHCYRKSDTIIRIISARKATVRETISYNKNLF